MVFGLYHQGSIESMIKVYQGSLVILHGFRDPNKMPLLEQQKQQWMWSEILDVSIITGVFQM